MISKTLSPEHSREVMQKMCEMIGLSFGAVSFIQPDWYLLHTWSKQEEQEFILWLTLFLLKNKYARNKRQAEHEAQEINAHYGWKTV